MNHDQPTAHFAGQAELYVLGLLDAEEMARCEAHLGTGCPACLAEVRSFEEAATAFPLSIANHSPGPAVRARLFNDIRSEQVIRPYIQRADEGDWTRTSIPGVSVKRLYRRGPKQTVLLKIEAGAEYPAHPHDHLEECIVLEGVAEFDGIFMYPGDYSRFDAGLPHSPTRTSTGCVLFITTG